MSTEVLGNPWEYRTPASMREKCSEAVEIIGQGHFIDPDAESCIL